MAGYSRQSAAQIVNGEIVSAPPLNAEFNQVLAAFNVSTGHRHDGTANEGPLIALIADPNRHNEVLINTSLNQIDFKINVSSAAVTQFSLVDGAILPTTDDDISLGSTTAEFKDLFLDGTANIDSLIADTADINAGTIDGVTIGGNAAGAGTFTVLNASSVDINSGTINNAVIGGATPAAGTFTVVNASSADIDSGTIDNAVIGGATPAAGTFTALGATNVTVTGSASSIGSVAFTSTGATVTGTLDVTGAFSASDVTVTGSASSIGSVAFTSTSATVTGNLTVSGSVTASTISAVNVSVTGSASSIGAVAFTTTSATITGNLVVSGSVTASTISAVNVTVTGSASSIGAVAFTSTSATVTGNLSVSGSITASTLSVAGNISASTISVSNITATGSASSIGAATFTSTAVTITKMISGNVDITGGSITGIPNIFDPGSAMSYTFSGATADADPGNGNIRLNNVSSSAATTIFIDNVDALSSADMTAFISLLSGGNNPSSILGTVTLRKATFPEIFAQYSVTAVTNASGYQKLTVSNKGASSAAPFTSGDSLLVDIMLSGDKGDAGEIPDGAGTGNVFSSLSSTTVAAGTIMKTVSTASSTLFMEPTTIIVDGNNNMTGLSTLSMSGGSLTIRSGSGSPSHIDMYCEVNNLHFTRLQAQPHANYSGNITVTLPATSGTLALLSQKANFTDVTASTLTVSGNISADTITVTNITATGSASSIGAVAFTSTAATVTGNLTVTGSVTASSLTVDGNISASTITVSDITATGSASTIGAVAFTSTSATITGGLTVTGAVTASNITVVGSASTIGAVAFTSTGATVTGGLTVTGAVTASNISIVGSASSIGAITITTTSVGINTSTVTAGTSLEVTGNMRITTTGNGLIFPDGSKQTVAASAGVSTGKAIAMAIVFG